MDGRKHSRRDGILDIIHGQSWTRIHPPVKEDVMLESFFVDASSGYSTQGVSFSNTYNIPVRVEVFKEDK